MTSWLLLTVNSVTFGGLLFLLSAGFSLIFGLMRIPNLTHGSLFMLGAYIGATFVGGMLGVNLTSGWPRYLPHFWSQHLVRCSSDSYCVNCPASNWRRCW